MSFRITMMLAVTAIDLMFCFAVLRGQEQRRFGTQVRNDFLARFAGAMMRGKLVPRGISCGGRHVEN
jgi:hypothetical protein